MFNQVSNQTRECLVQHGEGELQLSIVSPPTEIIDGVTVVYVEKNKATNLSILVNNTSGQNKIVVALSGLGRCKLIFFYLVSIAVLTKDLFSLTILGFAAKIFFILILSNENLLVLLIS